MAMLYMQGLRRVSNMSDCGSISLNNVEYALMSLNMPEHDLNLLSDPEYAWKCLNKMFWLCQDSQYTAI